MYFACQGLMPCLGPSIRVPLILGNGRPWTVAMTSIYRRVYMDYKGDTPIMKKKTSIKISADRHIDRQTRIKATHSWQMSNYNNLRIVKKERTKECCCINYECKSVSFILIRNKSFTKIRLLHSTVVSAELWYLTVIPYPGVCLDPDGVKAFKVKQPDVVLLQTDRQMHRRTWPILLTSTADAGGNES